MSTLKQTISEQQYYHFAIFKALLEDRAVHKVDPIQ